ncbi:MAG: biotin--[acetyl-CoA-carboxylase] ligase [Elusimicrobiota bacterium]|jgi:BirA family biotin operon repressor/biotin-[acetyl-CoA-carboxylase] ligase|nr:biotin--[acetyl-CoA-carboxylase] ligase [Elusimicrobiota bacterium]
MLFLKPKRFKVVDSTQKIAKEMAAKNCPQGLIIVADRQKESYGRLGRSWSAGVGGLWFSFVLRPKISLQKILVIAPLIAIALNKAIKKSFKISSKIKWPNDILIERKKVAGILVEASSRGRKVDWLVIGIGVNVNNRLPNFLQQTAATLKQVCGKNVSKEVLLESFAREFDLCYKKFLKVGFSSFVNFYNKNLSFYNREVIVFTDDLSQAGINKGIAKTGKLVLKMPQGIKRVSAGTLRLAD